VIQIWRIVKPPHASTAFEGEGPKIFGGRWNQKGSSVVYTSESLALAVLEIFVQIDSPPSAELVSIPALIPPELSIKTIQAKELPENWNTYPANHITKNLGTIWLTNLETLILKVPSVIIPSEFNYLINPEHPDFKKIKIGKPSSFSFDQKMWKKH